MTAEEQFEAWMISDKYKGDLNRYLAGKMKIAWLAALDTAAAKWEEKHGFDKYAVAEFLRTLK